jgi:uncharacterized protein YbjT (DUF2867 family)
MIMTAAVLVTGGTGTLGQHLVPLLQAAGSTIRVLSRHDREPSDGVDYVTVDLMTNEGIERALDGIETVVHLAGGPKGDDQSTRNLVTAAARAGTRHVVGISVIGADRMPIGYFRAKRGAEQAIAESGVPWTVLRAAQFHDLTFKVVQAMAKLPVVPIPGGLRLQPVDARDVAERLAELALAAPAGRVRDLAGPRVYTMRELVDGYLRARGKHRLTMPVRVPGQVGRAYRAGANLALTDIDSGKRTWEDFLTDRIGRSGAGLPAQV